MSQVAGLSQLRELCSHFIFILNKLPRLIIVEKPGAIYPASQIKRCPRAEAANN